MKGQKDRQTKEDEQPSEELDLTGSLAGEEEEEDDVTQYPVIAASAAVVSNRIPRK